MLYRNSWWNIKILDSLYQLYYNSYNTHVYDRCQLFMLYNWNFSNIIILFLLANKSTHSMTAGAFQQNNQYLYNRILTVLCRKPNYCLFLIQTDDMTIKTENEDVITNVIWGYDEILTFAISQIYIVSFYYLL